MKYDLYGLMHIFCSDGYMSAEWLCYVVRRNDEAIDVN
jgi:hypothetical protein